MDDNFLEHTFALVVIGGGGTRLWPRSRNARPKQFLPLFNKKTLAQITLYRFSKFLPWEKIYLVTTTKGYKDELLKEVPELVPDNILVEPLRRNTAPAHAWGAAEIMKKDPDAVIINEYSDHLMSPEESYFATVKAAAHTAYRGDWLVAIGIKPTYANIGYGYVKRGDKFSVIGGKDIYKLEKFTEKPNLKVAQEYLKSGDYFWNAGQYIWRADSILSAFRKYQPDIFKAIEEIGRGGSIEKAYEKIPEISVDYAISEKVDNFLLVVADYQWKDIGDWKEVWETLTKNSKGNVIIDGDEPGGRVINIDTSDALIHMDGRLIAIIDVDDVVVVDTKDALLVCSKSRAQNVKKIVEQLKKEKVKELL